MKYGERPSCGRQVSPPHQPCETACKFIDHLLFSQKFINQNTKWLEKNTTTCPRSKSQSGTDWQRCSGSLSHWFSSESFWTSSLAVYYGLGSRKPTVVLAINTTATSPKPKQLIRQLEINTDSDQIQGRSANPEEKTNCPKTDTACTPQKDCGAGAKVPPFCSNPDPTLTLPPCDCAPSPVVCPTTPRSIPAMSPQGMAGERPFDLLRGEPKNTGLKPIVNYPARSYERLQVAINLMDNYYEPYYDMFTRRKCGFKIDSDQRRICPLCQDRYSYLRCIYDNDLVNQGHNQTQLNPMSQGTYQSINSKAYKSSVDNKWGVKLLWPNEKTDNQNYLQLSDYSTSQFIANRNAMTLNAHYPGSSTKGDYPKCIPCNVDIGKHGNCIVKPGNNEASFNWI